MNSHHAMLRLANWVIERLTVWLTLEQHDQSGRSTRFIFLNTVLWLFLSDVYNWPILHCIMSKVLPCPCLRRLMCCWFQPRDGGSLQHGGGEDEAAGPVPLHARPHPQLLPAPQAHLPRGREGNAAGLGMSLPQGFTRGSVTMGSSKKLSVLEADLVWSVGLTDLHSGVDMKWAIASIYAAYFSVRWNVTVIYKVFETVEMDLLSQLIAIFVLSSIGHK